jgi:hypothetical protein
MSTVELEYDPWRGGFCVHFGRLDRASSQKLFGGWLVAFRSEDSRVSGIESFRDRGGWRLAGLRAPAPLVEGDFPLTTDGGQAGPILVRQCSTQLEFWFGCRPIEQPPTHYDTGHSIAIWIPNSEVAGISLGVSSLATDYPFASVRVSPEDFK